MAGVLTRLLLLALLFQHCQVPLFRNITYYVPCQGEEQDNANFSCVSFDAILENAEQQETALAPDSSGLIPFPRTVGLMEPRPDEGVAWPSFTAMRRLFFTAQERLSAFVRKLVSQLGFEFGLRENTRPSQIYFSDKAEAIVEETSFAPGSQDPESPCTAIALVEIHPENDSAWHCFAAIGRFFHLTVERLQAYLRELIGCFPEEWLTAAPRDEWSSRMWAIAAAVEAAVVIGTCLISRRCVRSAHRSTLQELDRAFEKLLAEQNKTRIAQNQAQDIEFQLQAHESERAYHALLISDALSHLHTAHRKCQERELSLARKQADSRAEARIKKAQEESQGYKRRQKEKHQVYRVEVSFEEETLSSQIKEEMRLRKLVADVRASVTEMLGVDFSSSADSSVNQRHPSRTVSFSTQTY